MTGDKGKLNDGADLLADAMRRAFTDAVEAGVAPLREDVAGLREDVAGLKTDVAEVRGEISQLHHKKNWPAKPAVD